MQSQDAQLGLIAKLNEIKEQIDSSSSQDQEDADCGDENEAGSESAGSRQEPHSSDPKNNHLGYAHEAGL